MKEHTGETFVLIHGAWNGGWVWGDVADILRKSGNVVYTPTLAGVGTRARDDVPSINLSTHVNEITHLIVNENLKDIVLVGWSYGGFVAAGVTSKAFSRIKKVIYLDSIIPENFTSLTDYIPDANRVAVREIARKGGAVPPPAAADWGLRQPSLAKLVEARMTPHPAKTFVETLHLTYEGEAVAKSFIYCAGYGKTMFSATYEHLKAQQRIPCLSIESNHFCMVSDPDITAQALVLSANA